MQSVSQFLHLMTADVAIHLATLCVLLALVWQSSGLGVSRQWYLLPLLCGLTGLLAFLVNPIADSTSTLDLRNQLLGTSMLFLLVAVQLVVVALSMIVGLRLAAGRQVERWRLLLGILHCLPSPVLLLGVLWVEQQWLSQQVGARPEWVGLQVSVIVAGLLLVGWGLVYGLSEFQRTRLHLLGSLMLGTVLCIALSINESLPGGAMQDTTQAALNALVPGLCVAAVCVAIGFAWRQWQHSRSVPTKHVGILNSDVSSGKLTR